jgi:LysR family transcriptional regulator, carnitine catabolism transcriptional activator
MPINKILLLIKESDMIPNINLMHLKYFYDTVLLKSVSAAARENFVSQSAISQGISKLEQALQVNLTTHQRQIFQLTEEGAIVFKESKKIFEDIENLRNSLRAFKSEVSGEVHFASTNAVAQYFLGANYLKIKREYPLVKLNFVRGNFNFLHDQLKREQVSFILAVDAPDFASYEKKILSSGNFHLYKTKGIIENNGIFVDHSETFEVLNLRKIYFETYKKELVIQEALSGWGMVATFVLNGYGLGFLPEFIFSGNQNVEKVDFDFPPISYKICAFKLKGSTLPVAAEAILKTMNEKQAT